MHNRPHADFLLLFLFLREILALGSTDGESEINNVRSHKNRLNTISPPASPLPEQFIPILTCIIFFLKGTAGLCLPGIHGAGPDLQLYAGHFTVAPNARQIRLLSFRLNKSFLLITNTLQKSMISLNAAEAEATFSGIYRRYHRTGPSHVDVRSQDLLFIRKSHYGGGLYDMAPPIYNISAEKTAARRPFH